MTLTDVLRLTEGEEQRDQLLLRRALALRLVQPREVEPLVEDLASRFAAMRRRSDDSHLRDEARFTLVLAGRPKEALATRNWARQRGPADARILLEAAVAAGEPEAARPFLDWMAKTEIEDVVLRELAKKLNAAS